MQRGTIRSSLLAGAIAVTASGPVFAGNVAGVITDPTTGKPLSGANVSISGTSYGAVSGEDGRFTLSNVPEGSYSVSASRSGFHTSSIAVTVPKDGTVAVTFDAYAAALDEVVVAADRYQASNAQLNAANTIDVLSAADLEHTAVHNVAEALGMMPGVNVMNTGQSFVGGVDGASRGEGMFTSIRGMNGEYNVNMINGVNVAQGTPYSREVQLSLLPPSGLQTIVINKTSKADMDGDAIGGTVDFRTPTAYDYSQPLMLSLTASGRLESRAMDYKRDGTGYGVAGEGALKFGRDQQFGVYASGYYDIRHYANSELGAVMETLCCDNAWAFATQTASGGNPAGFNPATNLQTTGFNVGVSSGSTERYGGNFSFDWLPDDMTSAYFRLTYAVANTEQDSTLSQLVGMNVTNAETGSTGLYHPVINNLSTRIWYETNPEFSDLVTLQTGGEHKFGDWTLSPNLFMSWGDDDRDHIETSARTTINGGNGFAYGGSTLATYNSAGFPIPQINSQVLGGLSTIATAVAEGGAGEITPGYSGQVRGGGKLDVRRDFGGALDFIKFGVKYEDSARQVTQRDWSNNNSNGLSLAGNGLVSGYYSAIYPGVYEWQMPIINQKALYAQYYQNASPNNLDTCSSLFINNWNCNTQRATEAVTAGYVMANLKFGDFEVIPGFRYEHTDISNTFWVTPHDADGNELVGHFSKNHTSFSDPLPSVFVNYRPDPNQVYRAAIWESYTRPPFIQLGGGSTTSISNGVTTITEGNPNLKAITARNFDLSGEWHSDHGGQMTVAGFAKQLEDYIFDNGSTFENQATSGGGNAIYHHPTNGGDASIYGTEISARQKFQDMPEPFDGLGIGANLTRQWTSVNTLIPGLDKNERMQNAPDWMANVELFYEKAGYSLDMIYHYSGAYVSQYDYLSQGGSWDDLWIRSSTRIDLHAGYDFGNGAKADLSVSNLFDNVTYWSHIGKESLAISDIVDSGRTILMTVKYTY